ncbi:MAG: glucose-6-phosphate isomerase [Thermodesulfovibrionales bacterium]
MLQLNFSNMMSEVIGEKGISEKQVEAAREKAVKAHGEIAGRKWPELAFMDLRDQDTSLIKEIAADIRESAQDFVLLGIGGSALGPKTILEALSPMHNLKKRPRAFIYDNVDPLTLENILSLIDMDKAVFNVVTKSGSTAETMASFMIIHERLRDAARQVVATTDPEKGYLRQIAAAKGMRTLPIPEKVGGRYSVLSPVGLLLAEVIGVSSDELLRGAREMHDRCADPEPWKNPASIFAILLYLMYTEEKRPINVFIPYSDRLKPLSEWFCQLWAESLGKLGIGPTPYPSVGTTDQHSQLQLWMEGPEDKVVVFVKVGDHGADLEIPRVFGDTGVAYLGGHTIGELMAAEEESTELCLAKKGRPNMTLAVPSLDAYHLGQLFYFLELATAFIGFLYGVNPFNQPSVEEGKDFTYGMMGRKGYEQKREEVEQARLKKTCWVL